MNEARHSHNKLDERLKASESDDLHMASFLQISAKSFLYFLCAANRGWTVVSLLVMLTIYLANTNRGHSHVEKRNFTICAFLPYCVSNS